MQAINNYIKEAIINKDLSKSDIFCSVEDIYNKIINNEDIVYENVKFQKTCSTTDIHKFNKKAFLKVLNVLVEAINNGVIKEDTGISFHLAWQHINQLAVRFNYNRALEYIFAITSWVGTVSVMGNLTTDLFDAKKLETEYFPNINKPGRI